MEVSREYIFQDAQDLKRFLHTDEQFLGTTYLRPEAENFLSGGSLAIVNSCCLFFRITGIPNDTISIADLDALAEALPTQYIPTPQNPLKLVWVVPEEVSSAWTSGPFEGQPGTSLRVEEAAHWTYRLQQYVHGVRVTKWTQQSRGELVIDTGS